MFMSPHKYFKPDDRRRLTTKLVLAIIVKPVLMVDYIRVTCYCYYTFSCGGMSKINAVLF